MLLSNKPVLFAPGVTIKENLVPFNSTSKFEMSGCDGLANETKASPADVATLVIFVSKSPFSYCAFNP